MHYIGNAMQASQSIEKLSVHLRSIAVTLTDKFKSMHALNARIEVRTFGVNGMMTHDISI